MAFELLYYYLMGLFESQFLARNNRFLDNGSTDMMLHAAYDTDDIVI